METPYTLRHFGFALAAFFARAGSRARSRSRSSLHEGPFESLYRSMVTVSLTGLDTAPDRQRREGGHDRADPLREWQSSATSRRVVELVAHGVLTGAVAEPKEDDA